MNLNRETDEELALEIMRRTARELLCALYGEPVGNAVFRDLVNEADEPNSKLAPGVARRTVSRICCRLRRGLGAPIRNPSNAR